MSLPELLRHTETAPTPLRGSLSSVSSALNDSEWCCCAECGHHTSVRAGVFVDEPMSAALVRIRS